MLDPLGAFGILTLALLGLRRLTREASASVWWFAGWFAAAVSGVLYLDLDRDAMPAIGAVGLFVGTLSPTLILVGVMRLVDRSVPGWLVPSVVALATVRGALGLADLWTPVQALGLVACPPAALASAWLAHRGLDRARASVSRRLLAPSLIAFGALIAASELSQVATGGATPALAIAWLLLGPPTFALQLSALTEHGRDALVRSSEELEKRVLARTQELDHAVASLRDEVEERRNAEAALRESEERYRNVSELSSDFSFQLRIDPEEGIRREWVTEAFEQITGYPADVLDGDGWTEMLAQAERLDAQQAVVSASGRGKLQGRLHRILRPDGESRWLSLRFKTQKSPLDGELRVVGAASDVTDARRAEEERLALVQQVEEAQRVESISLLTGGIAHDFNNLLAVILGNLRLASEELPPDSDIAKRLQRAHAAAKHAVSLTEQMLSYSGKASVTLEPVDLSKLTRGLEVLLRASIGSSCRLVLDLGAGATAAGDPTRLRQVLVNLVTNASESLEEGRGQVTIRTGRAHLSKSKLAGLVGAAKPAAGEYAWFEVSDDGEGMERDLQRRIFEPFYTTKFSGRGLGLAASLGIVRAHGGVIDLDSEPNRGTRVRVLIPATEARPTRKRANRPPALRDLRVLVVDDEDHVLELATEYLRREGCLPVAADAGRRALELFEADEEGFDAAVIDLAMPEIDGKQLFCELRRARPELPVVIASGYSRERLAESFAQESRVEFLRKPYAVEELMTALSSAIGQDPRRASGQDRRDVDEREPAERGDRDSHPDRSHAILGPPGPRQPG